ncbi:MAG TPA: hypothetical protein ENO13_01240 [Candidatus Bathyarchaeota archaeon]|nr:hypothetical protein [Candidatus Bathyarchaeota archaeon]
MTKKLAGDVIVKLYHWIAKKRYLQGKYVYTYERLYIPVPRVFHKHFKSILKGHVKMEVEEQNGRLGVFLTPVKTLSHAESPPDKT